jgi:hypothetical protein
MPAVTVLPFVAFNGLKANAPGNKATAPKGREEGSVKGRRLCEGKKAL